MPTSRRPALLTSGGRLFRPFGRRRLPVQCPSRADHFGRSRLQAPFGTVRARPWHAIDVKRPPSVAPGEDSDSVYRGSYPCFPATSPC
jgi:hypothetical protein